MKDPDSLRSAWLRFPESTGRRWAVAFGMVLVAGLAYAVSDAFRGFIDGVTSPLAMGDIRAVKRFILAYGWWAPLVSVLLMILQTLIAPLPAFILAIANAMAFGVFYGFVLTVFSAMLAAFAAFYISRWLGRPFLESWMKVGTLDTFVDCYGAWGVLLLRFFPAISFDYVSYAAGLTSMRPSIFGFATLVGMIPATLAYTLVGESVESANLWSLIGGAALLIVLSALTFCYRNSVLFKKMFADKLGARAAERVRKEA